MATGFETYVTAEDLAELRAFGFDESDEALVKSWCQFSAIQAANWINPSYASAARFRKWRETWNDQEAWS
jgi:hypothetical protein